MTLYRVSGCVNPAERQLRKQWVYLTLYGQDAGKSGVFAWHTATSPDSLGQPDHGLPRPIGAGASRIYGSGVSA
ncbi:MAG: hypothetical protein AAF801_18970, partial [Pseudomonadota bacterium]